MTIDLLMGLALFFFTEKQYQPVEKLLQLKT